MKEGFRGKRRDGRCRRCSTSRLYDPLRMYPDCRRLLASSPPRSRSTHFPPRLRSQMQTSYVSASSAAPSRMQSKEIGFLLPSPNSATRPSPMRLVPVHLRVASSFYFGQLHDGISCIGGIGCVHPAFSPPDQCLARISGTMSTLDPSCFQVMRRRRAAFPCRQSGQAVLGLYVS